MDIQYTSNEMTTRFVAKTEKGREALQGEAHTTTNQDSTWTIKLLKDAGLVLQEAA